MGFSFDMLIDRYSLLNQLVNWLSDGKKMAAQWRPKGGRGFSKHHQAHTDMSFWMVSQ